MKWRLARSLEVLRNQANAKFPGRSKLSDGTIGDRAHASRSSDHNVNSQGVVCALDLTNDPAHGLDARKLAEALVASKDERIKYIISNGQICSGPGANHPAWVWRPYSGANKHTKHVHISVRSPAALYDSEEPWRLDGAAVSLKPVQRPAVGSTLWIQIELNKHGAKLKEDGKDGPKTDAAIRAFAVEKLKG